MMCSRHLAILFTMAILDLAEPSKASKPEGSNPATTIGAVTASITAITALILAVRQCWKALFKSEDEEARSLMCDQEEDQEKRPWETEKDKISKALLGETYKGSSLCRVNGWTCKNTVTVRFGWSFEKMFFTINREMQTSAILGLFMPKSDVENFPENRVVLDGPRAGVPEMACLRIQPGRMKDECQTMTARMGTMCRYETVDWVISVMSQGTGYKLFCKTRVEFADDTVVVEPNLHHTYLHRH